MSTGYPAMHFHTEENAPSPSNRLRHDLAVHVISPLLKSRHASTDSIFQLQHSCVCMCT
eukprot:jgi/Botrbrau1/22968/Bobra.0030s0040.1